MLRSDDAAALEHLGLAHTVTTEAGFVLVQIQDFPFGSGLLPSSGTLLLRLPPGFPDATPDMFWLNPAVRTSAGGVVPGTEITEQHVGVYWQRWSRHIQGQWRPGMDNLATYLAYVRRCLDLAGGRA